MRLAFSGVVTVLALCIGTVQGRAASGPVPSDPGWGPDHLVSAKFAPNARYDPGTRPDIAMNTSGALVVSWFNFGGRRALRGFVQVRDADGRWSRARTFERIPNYAEAHVGIDAAGDAFVVWPGNWGYRPAGGTWTFAALPHRVKTLGYTYTLDVAPNGWAAIAFTDGSKVYVQRRPPKGPWSRTVHLDGHFGSPKCYLRALTPAVSVDARGVVSALWTTSGHCHGKDIASKWVHGGLAATGSPLPHRSLGPSPTDDEYEQNVARSSSGRSIAVWSATDGASVALRVSGETWQLYDPPAMGGNITGLHAGVTDSEASIWWSVKGVNGAGTSNVYEATYEDGAWSDPRIVATATAPSAVVVSGAGRSAAGNVVAIVRTNVDFGDGHHGNTLSVRTNLAGYHHAYTFPSSSNFYANRAPQALAIPVAGARAGLLWQGPQGAGTATDQQARLYVRTYPGQT